MTKYFQEGSRVPLTFDRAVPKRNELILPLTVIDDTPDRTVAFVTAGTPITATTQSNGEPMPRNIPYREMAALDRTLSLSTWKHTDVIFIWQPEWHWDVRLYWQAETRDFLGWYVNVQDEVRRTINGFATTDHFLDVTIQPDRSWSLKDEAELSDAVDLGLYTIQQQDQIHSWAGSAIELLETRQWPFNVEPVSFRSLLESATPSTDS